MKKSFFVFLLGILTSVSGFSQEKYSTYHNSYIDKDYEISVSFKEGKTSLYIDLVGFDRLYDVGGINIDDKSYPGFIDNLTIARSKYDEWTKVAKENNVRELSKEVELRPQTLTGYFKTSREYNFDFSVRPSFEFKILDNEKGLRHLLIIRTEELKSSSNEYITSDGFALIFTSVEEMDDFMELISMAKLEEFKNKSANKSDLFKN